MVVLTAEEAEAAVRAGTDVVLAVPVGPDAVPLRPPGPGPGRLAVIVGDPDDPVVRAAAAEMGRELFGPSGRQLRSATS